MELTEKHIKEAKLVAQNIHANQSYDSIFPYEKHLEDVVSVLTNHGITAPKYICAAYLHDSIEDGNISYRKIANYFGAEVAEIVYCVTDELGRSREERKAKTLIKTKNNLDAILIKLADRIANIEHGGRIDLYLKEYVEFKKALFTDHETHAPLWFALDILLGKAKLII